jgi:hypothetical protein
VALVPRRDLRHLVTPLHLAALVVIAALALALAVYLTRRPALVLVLLLLAAPFRIPVDLGHQHAFLLLPLYGVLAASSLALIARALRGDRPAPVPWLLAVPAAAFIALDSCSLLWSADVQQGTIELVFFILPFAALVTVVARTRLEPWLPRVLAVELVGLASLFAVIGLWQAATHRVFFARDVRFENAYTSYFRVTSMFKDPSLYGRWLALAIGVLMVLHLLGRLRIEIVGALVALLWGGLWFSYSQSSQVAILAVTVAAVLVLGDRRTRVIVASTAAAIVVAGAVLVALDVHGTSSRRTTSGRAHLVSVTWTVVRNHPLDGVGVGGQPLASRNEADLGTAARKNASHTTPLTVAAELGVGGFIVYVAFLAAAARLLLATYRRARTLALCLSAAFLTLFVHSLFYSGFFEDPVTWGALALAATALAAPARVRETQPEAQPREAVPEVLEHA